MVSLLVMNGYVVRALFLVALLFVLNACASNNSVGGGTSSGPPVAGEKKGEDPSGAVGAGVGPNGASGRVSF